MKYKKIVAYNGTGEDGQVVFELADGWYAIVNTDNPQIGAAAAKYLAHFTRFCPYLKADVENAPKELLEKGISILEKEGIKHKYKYT